MLNGTTKKFDIAESAGNNVAIKTYDNQSYTTIGREMASVPGGTQTATPSIKYYALNGSEVNPSAYMYFANDFSPLLQKGHWKICQQFPAV